VQETCYRKLSALMQDASTADSADCKLHMSGLFVNMHDPPHKVNNLNQLLHNVPFHELELCLDI